MLKEQTQGSSGGVDQGGWRQPLADQVRWEIMGPWSCTQQWEGELGELLLQFHTGKKRRHKGTNRSQGALAHLSLTYTWTCN